MNSGKPKGLLQPIIGLFRRIKIQHRLLFIFFFVSLVPTVCIGLYAYNVYTHSINTKLAQASQETMHLMNNNVMTQLEKFRDYCSVISVSPEIQDGLAMPPAEQVDYYSNHYAVRDIDLMLQAFPFQSKYLKNIRIVNRNGDIVYDLGYDDISMVRFHELLDGIDHASPKDSLQYIKTYRSYDKIVLGRKIFSMYSSTTHIGYILIYIDESLVSGDIFSNVSFGPGSNILLSDSAGNIISSQNHSLLGGTLDSALFSEIEEKRRDGIFSFNSTIQSSSNLVICNYDPNYDNYLVATIPSTYITRETASINTTLGLIAVLLIAVCLIATLLVYASIVQPVRRIISYCNVTADEDVDVKINDESKDELGFLARTIDQMVIEIKLLAYHWKNDQQRKREMELEVLQYQINPHFLFNTLNTLKWIAVINNVPVLDDGISSLSALLQSTLLKKHEFISISEELDNLRHYISIQKIRYADSFDVVYELAEEALGYEMPRFILQPLAENAIIHSTSDDGTAVCITVRCRFFGEDKILLEVADNGKGFDIGKVMDAKKERFSGIGLSNVDERLQLHYGSGFGLTIVSADGQGTTCRILLPRREVKETES